MKTYDVKLVEYDGQALEPVDQVTGVPEDGLQGVILELLRSNDDGGYYLLEIRCEHA